MHFEEREESHRPLRSRPPVKINRLGEARAGGAFIFRPFIAKYITPGAAGNLYYSAVMGGSYVPDNACARLFKFCGVGKIQS